MKRHIDEVVEKIGRNIAHCRAHPNALFAIIGNMQRTQMALDINDVEDLLKAYRELRQRMESLEK